MAHILRREGFLIHSSLKPPELVTRCSWPFLRYYPNARLSLSQGCIIGYARLGRVITTHDWVREFKPNKVGLPEVGNYALGDYSAGRWAWELVGVIKFKNPVPAKGSLSLWNYTQGEMINIFTQ